MSKKTVTLPEGIIESDLVYPRMKDGWNKKQADMPKYQVVNDKEFEIWYTERFGWCIPTLDIRNNTGRMSKAETRRTYGTTLDGQTVSIGLGPHVLHHYRVYVTKATEARLQKFIDIKTQGLGKAQDTRDRISTRRANTIARRQNFLGGWF